MKTVLLLAALTGTTPAFAQTAPAATAPTTAATAAPATPAAAPKFTLDTPIETIAADPAGKKALDETMPGLTTHEAYEMFKSMSLNQLQPMAGGKITDEVMAKTKAALEAVK
ncbi:hypothetical protein LZK98_16220 [Sphingomonas cannabina]|uniref:hypothetical protein n=1 Tax=Sphingomonas cannabina TaxID=2899123 RepID=UPI001F3B89ED|nr:hypothetical protein [Sphingomonas cannabina]UIJ44590.1 hypothetical protein LZK98_16220 [Sphingomonas cannabina]